MLLAILAIYTLLSSSRQMMSGKYQSVEFE